MMSEGTGMTMEEAEEAEENALLGGEEEEEDPGHSGVTDDFDETAEDLMTDMKLEDEIDEVRVTEPDFNWTYHIEIYPWSADDMTENFVRLLKLAEFSQIFMRKKGICRENGDPESVADKLHGRRRKGSIHFYTDNFQNAKNIIRSSTWKAMVTKQLTFEITRRGPGSDIVESAYFEVDTYTACKCRFRDRPKGEFKDRTAKVSCIPGTISLEFLDVVFCRAYAVTGGSTVREYYKERDGKLQQKLSQIKDFDGSFDFDCLSKGSCRSFVTAHKNVYIDGQRISIVANNKETMVVPESVNNADNIGKKEQANAPPTSPSVSETELGNKPLSQWPRGILAHQMMARGGVSAHHTFQSGRGGLLGREPNLGLVASGRGRGLGRSAIQPQRPVSTTARAGPGMPVPMTGRQKMNEKMRRSNLGQALGPSASSGMLNTPGGAMGPRNTMAASIGESFKQEIASLHKQLQKNTAELEAKIAMLQQSTNPAAFYEADQGDWDDTGFGDEEEYSNDSLAHSGDIGSFVKTEVQNSYQYNAGGMNRLYGLTGNQNMMVSVGPGLQGMGHMSAMGSQGMMHSGPSTEVQGMMPGPGMLSQSVPGQMPQSMCGQMAQSMPGLMSQTAPAQMMQSISGQMPPNMSVQMVQPSYGQMPPNMPGQMQQPMHGPTIQQMSAQMPQVVSGQMPQGMQGQMSQSVSGHVHRQMPQSMPGQMSQSYPVHMAQSTNGQMSQSVPGGFSQVRPQRGGASYQRLRGMMRGRGKARGVTSSAGGW